jgi:hypothetical protein
MGQRLLLPRTGQWVRRGVAPSLTGLAGAGSAVRAALAKESVRPTNNGSSVTGQAREVARTPITEEEPHVEQNDRNPTPAADAQRGEPSTARASYLRPELRRLGTVQDLTAAAGGNPIDGLGGSTPV